MAKIYARKIMNGEKTIDDVPQQIREQVIAVLESYGYSAD